MYSPIIVIPDGMDTRKLVCPRPGMDTRLSEADLPDLVSSSEEEELPPLAECTDDESDGERADDLLSEALVRLERLMNNSK